MRRIPQVLIHCASIVALVDIGACTSEGGPGSSSEVQAEAEGSGLHFKKHHEKKKKKHHHEEDCADDDAGTPACQSLALQVDSIKHREDTAKAEGAIDVQVPESLSAYYWGKRLQAELTLQQGDKRVVCSYAARRHKLHSVSTSLELERCDNGAKAGDSVTIEQAKLSLDCSGVLPLAKVWVELHEVEPCGEAPTPPVCDPAALDDGDRCTTDACDSATGRITHVSQTIDDNNRCTTDACDPATGRITHVSQTTDDNNRCTTDACDPASGVSHVPVTTNDTDACTIDACDPATGVSHVPLKYDDNDACTVDACAPATGASHVAMPVDDNNPCTVDACDRVTGPSHEVVPAEDDGNSCTDDVCDPAAGQVHRPTKEGEDCGDGAICRAGVCVILT